MDTRTTSGLEELLLDLKVETPIPNFANADVLNRPIDIYRSYLASTASKALECDSQLAYEAIQSANTKDNGDLTLVLPKLKIKAEKPKNLANEALPKFSGTPLFILPLPDNVHLRFFFSRKSLSRLILKYVEDRKVGYGLDPAQGLRDGNAPDSGHKKVLVEFSSPNLTSEFSERHLRSTIIGSQIANMYEKMGWEVVRVNYLGDWGKPLGLLAVGWQRFGSEEQFQLDPMGHLLDVFEKIEELFQPEQDASKKAHDQGQDTAAIESQGIYAEHGAFFKRMEDGEPDALDLWKRFRNASIDYYTKVYASMNIAFDDYSGESQVTPESIAEVESTLKEKDISEESDGCWLIDFKKHEHKNLGTGKLRTRTGSTTYLLRDVAAVLDRDKKYRFDKMIYVVTSAQDAHFHQVFQTLEFMGRGDLAAKLQHIGFGKVQGMSPQLGKVHLLGDILNQITNAMHDILGAAEEHRAHIENCEDSARSLGVSALILQDGSTRRATGYTFNTKKLAAFDGETSPYLQTCYAKVCSAVKGSAVGNDTFSDIDYTALQEEPWFDVLRIIAHYPDIVHSAFTSHEPSMIVGYLFHLVREINECLAEDEEEEEEENQAEPPVEEMPATPEALKAYRVTYACAKTVMESGMALLGLIPITRQEVQMLWWLLKFVLTLQYSR